MARQNYKALEAENRKLRKESVENMKWITRTKLFIENTTLRGENLELREEISHLSGFIGWTTDWWARMLDVVKRGRDAKIERLEEENARLKSYTELIPNLGHASVLVPEKGFVMMFKNGDEYFVNLHADLLIQLLEREEQAQKTIVEQQRVINELSAV